MNTTTKVPYRQKIAIHLLSPPDKKKIIDKSTTYPPVSCKDISSSSLVLSRSHATVYHEKQLARMCIHEVPPTYQAGTIAPIEDAMNFMVLVAAFVIIRMTIRSARDAFS